MNWTSTVISVYSVAIFKELVGNLKSELTHQKAKLKEQMTELHRVRHLLREHLHITLKNVRDLREMNLKLLEVLLKLNVYFIR